MTDDPHLFLPREMSLDRPNAFVFSLAQCGQAYKLNQFAIGLGNPKTRAKFLDDPQKAMVNAGLSEQEIALIEARDWAGLVAAGGHILAVVKIGYSLGVLHHEVGAHAAGLDFETLQSLLPRDTGLTPDTTED